MYLKCLACEKGYREVTWNRLRIRECVFCGLAWREDFELPERHYEEKRVDLSEEKMNARVSNSRNRVRLLQKYIGIENVCDIGCGEGAFLYALKEAGAKNTFGIEPSGTVSAYIQKHGLIVERGRVEELSRYTAGRTVQVATLFHLIEHLQNPLAVLKEIHTALPKGGALMIETPNKDAYTIRKVKRDHSLIYPEHVFYFNEKTLKTLLQKAGFSIVASGARDFDEDNMSISESLYRLGLRKPARDVSDYSRRMGIADHGGYSEKDNFSRSDPFMRRMIRALLAKLVKLFGRGEYIWVIARK